MGEGRLHAVAKERDQKIEQTVIGVNRVLEIDKRGNVYKVFLRRRAREEHQIREHHDIHEEDREQQKLPDLQQRVCLGILTHTVVQVYAELCTDAPVHKRQHKHQQHHKYRDDDIGGQSVCVQ